MYDTVEYKRQKKAKRVEMRAIKSGDFGQEESFGGRSQIFGMQNMYSTGNKGNDALLGGVILALAGTLVVFDMIDFSLFSTDFFKITPFALLSGGVGMFVVYLFRSSIGSKMGISTEFVIWPIGVAITLITSLILFPFLMFGFFFNTSVSDLYSETKLGLYTIGAFVVVWGMSKFVYPMLFGILPQEIVLGLIIGGQFFLWMAIISIIPWGMLDGSKIYNYDRKTYWITLVILIIIILIDLSIDWSYETF